MPPFILAIDNWPRMPGLHREFLQSALTKLRADPRLVGVAAGGSFIAGTLDDYSDLDLIVIASPETSADVLRDGAALAARLGPLLASFPGDHVGELRLLICLYGPPLLHVDLKFLATHELAHRVEDPVILWDRDGEVSLGLARGQAHYPQPDLQWIEDRFWVWVHYIVTKIARGELFEALDGLAFIRGRVLGPLMLLDAGLQPNGVRRVEGASPLVPQLTSTLGAHDRRSCKEALEVTVALYASLRERVASAAAARQPVPEDRPYVFVRRAEAERAARAYLEEQGRLLGL